MDNVKDIKCLVVDDEALARKLLSEYLNKIPNMKVVATCDTALAAHKVLNEREIDLLFLDIQMPDLTGIEWLKMLPQKPITILTTAYEQYAIDGYDLDIADYLLKPIGFQRFYKSVSRAVKRIHPNIISNSVQSLETLNPSGKDHFFVKADYKLINIHFDDVLYVEGMREYIRIHTKNQRITTLLSMSKLMKILPVSQFARIHRSYIVNLKNIKEVAKNSVVIGEQRLPISQGQKEQFMERITLIGSI
jgi:DNA-binding LytR/AlgR family response regulator